jgi:hypothetical protein
MNRMPLSYPAAAPAGNLPAGVVPAGTLPAAAFQYQQPQGMTPAPYMQQMAQQPMQQTMPQQAMPQGAPAVNPAPGMTNAAQVKRDLNELMKSSRLPAGFDLVAAAQDPAFVRLTMELPAYAAVRVYAAERRAANAEQQAMQTLLQRLRAREGLPRAARADTAAAASRDYLSMSPEEFARVEREFRDKARRGIKVKL